MTGSSASTVRKPTPAGTRRPHVVVVGAFLALYAGVTALLMEVPVGLAVLDAPQFETARFLVGGLIAALGAFSLSLQATSVVLPSTVFLAFQCVFVHVPSVALCAVHPSLPLASTFMTSLALNVVGYLSGNRVQAPALRVPRLVAAVCAAPVFLWLAYASFVFLKTLLSGSFSLESVLDLDVLYDFREKVFSSFSGRDLTALSALGYFVFPLLAVECAARRSYVGVLIVFCMVMALYSTTGAKAYVAVPFLSLAVFRLARRGESHRFVLGFVSLVAAAVLAALVLGVVLDSPWPLALALRGLVTPGESHIIYFDYFRELRRLSIFDLFPSGLPEFGNLSVSEVVHHYVYGAEIGDGQGTNAGIFGTAYALYGVLGVAVYTVIAAVVLSVLDRFGARHTRSGLALSSIPSLFLLTNVSLTSAFVYYGLGFALVLAVCWEALFRPSLGQPSLYH
ncbi:MAG: hypothetical protein HZB56_11340 [Deltaproteobacteria bacterium]|nr:hypothetical protein [Deltaproteobacteria bacterium]